MQNFCDFIQDTGNHRLEFERRGDTLIVSFDNAGTPHSEPRDRRGWGHKFFSEEGHSTLGVIAYGSDWYRCPAVIDALVTLQRSGFFESFARVVMTGSSMGGFAATAFASLAPGCIVISFNPQSTLNAGLVPWETGHENGRKQDWIGPFHDGAVECRSASRAYILFDPYHRDDARHAARYQWDNIVYLRAPFLGHGLPVSFVELRILKSIMRTAISGDLTEISFRSMLSHRRSLGKYFKIMIPLLGTERHRRMGLSLCEKAVATFPEDIWFRQRLALFLAANARIGEAMEHLAQLDKERRRRQKAKRKAKLQA